MNSVRATKAKYKAFNSRYTNDFFSRSSCHISSQRLLDEKKLWNKIVEKTLNIIPKRVVRVCGVCVVRVSLRMWAHASVCSARVCVVRVQTYRLEKVNNRILLTQYWYHSEKYPLVSLHHHLCSSFCSTFNIDKYSIQYTCVAILKL